MATSSRKRKGRKLPPKITDLREQGRPNAKKPYRAYWWNRFSQPPRKGGHATFETLPEAEKWIQDCERDNAAFYQRGHESKVRSRSFGQVADKWASMLRLSYATCAGYRSNVRELQRYFGADTSVSSIDKEDVLGFLHDVQNVRGLTEGTAKVRFNVLNQILDAAMDQGLRADNPCRVIARPRERKHMPYVLTRDQFNAAVWQLPHRYRMPVLLAYHSGLRLGEICALRTRDVDLENGQIQVAGTRLQSGKTQDHPKGGDPSEQATIPDVLIPELELYMKEYPPTPAGELFTSGRYGGSVSPVATSTIRKEFKKACRKANLPADEIRFHDLRHTCATNYAKMDAQAYVIQRLLRHGRLETSQRYIDNAIGDEKAREWANRVARGS